MAGLAPWQNGGMKRATENRQATPVTSRLALTRQRKTAVGEALTLLTVGGLTAIVLTGCTGVSSAGTQPAASPSAVEPTRSGTVAGSEPGSSKPGTAGASGAITADGSFGPSTESKVKALAGAGVASAVLEVSAGRTPTGLEADAIESAVLQGKDCVLGHIRDGNVTVTVLPVLASGKCFVGAAA